MRPALQNLAASCSPKMTSQSPFQRLVRFVDEEGKEQYGDLALDVNAIQAQSRKTSVPILMGDIKQGFQKTSSKKSIIKVRSLRRGV